MGLTIALYLSMCLLPCAGDIAPQSDQNCSSIRGKWFVKIPWGVAEQNKTLKVIMIESDSHTAKLQCIVNAKWPGYNQCK